jgi:hypothetical protein
MSNTIQRDLFPIYFRNVYNYVGTSHIAPGLVAWLPNKATQQWRTGYLATEQCKPNNTKRFYLVGLEPTLKRRHGRKSHARQKI